MRQVIFCDLDSTIADTRHRHHMIGKGSERDSTDWVAYSMACEDDEPMHGTVRLLQLLKQAGHDIVILSGRSIEAEELTRAWLSRHGVPHDEVLLRSADDLRSNGESKAARLQEWLTANEEAMAALMLDDWPEVRDFMAPLGIPTLLVNPVYEDGPMKQYAALYPELAAQ